MRLESTALATEHVERRPAAILAADIAGCCRLFGAVKITPGLSTRRATRPIARQTPVEAVSAWSVIGRVN
jgi:hypothetical protein